MELSAFCLGIFLCFRYLVAGELKDTHPLCGDCLMLTPLIKEGRVQEARELSQVDSSAFLNLTSYSGFITVKPELDSHLFFWYVPATSKPIETTPWIIWLQGGPGYSSLLGLFNLIGPVKIVDGQVKRRDIAWTQEHSVLFIDNPVGAGFSFTRDPKNIPVNEDEVGEQLLIFLRQFMMMFPELQPVPLFIAGQSYAGKYVPALGIQIHANRNKMPVNLKGLAIGNGLIDLRCMMHYSQLAGALGLLDESRIDVLRRLEQTTVNLIDENRLEDAANKFNETIEYIKKYSEISVYNFESDPNNAPYEFEAFLDKKEVRELIHAGNASYTLNNQVVYYRMLADIANTTKPWVEELLDHYGVLLYSGQLDIILPYSLSKNLYASLRWSRRAEYDNAKRKPMRRVSDRRVAGWKKSGGNLMEVLIRRAGHSVPADQPEVAKFLIDYFIQHYKGGPDP